MFIGGVHCVCCVTTMKEIIYFNSLYLSNCYIILITDRFITVPYVMTLKRCMIVSLSVKTIKVFCLVVKNLPKDNLITICLQLFRIYHPWFEMVFVSVHLFLGNILIKLEPHSWTRNSLTVWKSMSGGTWDVRPREKISPSKGDNFFMHAEHEEFALWQTVVSCLFWGLW